MNPEIIIQEPKERQPYEPPAIIYEGELTTRAGSPPIGAPNSETDPARLFGHVD